MFVVEDHILIMIFSCWVSVVVGVLLCVCGLFYVCFFCLFLLFKKKHSEYSYCNMKQCR